MTRVFVLDDHEVVRRGLRAILAADGRFDVVGEASDAGRALAALRKCAPDVAVLDHHLVDGDGIELCGEITERFDDIRCVVLTSSTNDRDLIAAYEAGAAAYLVKDAPAREILDTVRAVAEGRQPLDEAQVRLARRRRRDTDAGHVDALTPQEHEIFELIRHGRTNREIAAAMSISDKTVKNYVSNLLAKLGVTRRAEAAAIAGRLEAHTFTGPRRPRSAPS